MISPANYNNKHIKALHPDLDSKKCNTHITFKSLLQNQKLYAGEFSVGDFGEFYFGVDSIPTKTLIKGLSINFLT